MASKVFDPVEPAHPTIVKLHDDLVSLYRVIREEYQDRIDDAFDRVSQQIGFIVTTTVPWVVEVADKGHKRGMKVGAKHLSGTLFERELTRALEGILKDSNPLPAGNFRVYLLWHEALKLRLRTEWMEPAHFRTEWMEPAHFTRDPRWALQRPQAVKPEVMEPAHWFDPGTRLDAEERVVLSVIDEVYPELRLADRVATVRGQQLERWPGIREPAHFRAPDFDWEKLPREALEELGAVLRRYGF